MLSIARILEFQSPTSVCSSPWLTGVTHIIAVLFGIPVRVWPWLTVLTTNHAVMVGLCAHSRLCSLLRQNPWLVLNFKWHSLWRFFGQMRGCRAVGGSHVWDRLVPAKLHIQNGELCFDIDCLSTLTLHRFALTTCSCQEHLWLFSILDQLQVSLDMFLTRSASLGPRYAWTYLVFIYISTTPSRNKLHMKLQRGIVNRVSNAISTDLRELIHRASSWPPARVEGMVPLARPEVGSG